MLLPSNTSTNTLLSPTSVEGSENGRAITVPANPAAVDDYQKNFALLTSLLLCNKTNTNISVYAKIVNGDKSAYLFYGLSLPPNVSFEVIDGNKVTLKEGDSLYLWHDTPAPNVMDAIVSYTLHRPLTTYDI